MKIIYLAAKSFRNLLAVQARIIDGAARRVKRLKRLAPPEPRAVPMAR